MNKSVSLVVLVALFGIAAAAIATDPMCIGKGDPEFFRKPGSCSEVYLCHKGQLSVRTCPDNLWFNAEHGYCTYRSNSNCTEEETPVTDPPTLQECTDVKIMLYPHEEDCGKYFICPGKGQEPIEASCTDKYYFSPEQKQCVPQDMVECAKKEQEVKCPDDLPEDDVLYLADPTDCSSYYLCVNKNQIQFSCQNGLMWNAKVDSCDHEENVVCAA